jgi:hypothetical protein
MYGGVMKIWTMYRKTTNEIVGVWTDYERLVECLNKPAFKPVDWTAYYELREHQDGQLAGGKLIPWYEVL